MTTAHVSQRSDGTYAATEALESHDHAGYACVVCGRLLEPDEYGVMVHDDVPHPPGMFFDEDERPQ